MLVSTVLLFLGCAGKSENKAAMDSAPTATEATESDESDESTEQMYHEEESKADEVATSMDAGAAVASEELLESPLMLETLSPAELNVFEKRAVQQANDLMDYLSIIADQSYDLELRQNTVVMAQELFDPERCTIEVGSNSMSSGTFLTELLDGKHVVKNFVSDNYKMEQPFEATSDSLYASTLSAALPTSNTSIRVYLKKNYKRIGHQRIDVWTIRFGDLKNSNPGQH